MKRTYLIGLTLVLGGACGGGGVSVEDLPDEIEDKICAAQVECGDFPDIASCQQAGIINVDIVGIQADIDAGVVSYDEDAAKRCVDAYDALLGCELIFTSEALRELQEACDAVFVGSVEIGGACTDGIQCAGEANCETVVCQEECCMGMCVADPSEPIAEVGQSCEAADCVDSAYCDDADVCVARVAVDGACDEFDACVAGALCDLDFETQTGTCVELPNEGETCNPDMFIFQCIRTDNFCDPADSTCKRKLDVGATCTTNECIDYAECINTTCTARPKLGETCVVDDLLECLPGLDCDNGTCVAETADPYCPLGG